MTINSKPLPSRTYLRECFEYDLMSGEAYWLERPIDHFDSYRTYSSWNNRFAFSRLESLTINGYYCASIDGVAYKLHRLCWMWWYGYNPLIIDHIDRNRTNNRIVNLRSVNKLENNINSKIRIDNTSGYKGVYAGRNGKWVASTQYNKKQLYLGQYPSPEEAAEAIKEFHK